MTDKNDKLIIKMAGIIKKQQLLINKMAQNMAGDPLDGSIGDYKDESGLSPSSPKPAPKPAPKPVAPAPKPVAPAPKPSATVPYGTYDMEQHFKNVETVMPTSVRQPTSQQFGDPESLQHRGPKTVRQPTSFQRGDTNSAMDGAGLPADLVAALDTTVQGVKGALNLEVSGKTVSVKYDMNRIKAPAEKVKRVIQAALSSLGYQVVDCIGETGLVANYV